MLIEQPSSFGVNRTITENSVLRVHKLLKTIFHQAVLWDCIDFNPTDKVIVPKTSYVRRNCLLPEEINILLKSIPNSSPLSLCVQLAFVCSLRKGEILGLTWNDINFEQRYIIINKELSVINKKYIDTLRSKELIAIFPDKTVSPIKTCKVLKTPKTLSSVRKVYVPDTLLINLAYYKQTSSSATLIGDFPLLFSDANGYPYSDKTLNNQFKKQLIKCKLPHVVFHSLRHSSVTYKLLITNGDIKSVQGDTGHAQATMVTEVYSHIIDQNRR